MKSKGRVAVLMSGGVDSSVAAALLKHDGYDVFGVYILGWTGTSDFPCSWQKEEADAKAVAKQLKIPFYTINVEETYSKVVVDAFVDGYRQGLTPNPDILCNKEVKFAAVWQAIRQFEPDFLATGHYAHLRREARSTNIELRNEEPYIQLEESSQSPAAAIFKARDETKDQSYFLWAIDRAILPKLIFPLGNLTKKEVRIMAKEMDLVTASKKDSQGVCFMGQFKVGSYLRQAIPTKKGQALLGDGRVIANHDGVQFYTIGQRLGAGSVSWTGDAPPLFVVAKDIASNRLVVGTDAQTRSSTLVASEVNWLSDQPKTKFVAWAKIRYRQEDVRVIVSKTGDSLLVKFDDPVRAITSGQSIVFYDGRGQLLGGAIIQSVPEQEKLIKKLNEKTASTSPAPLRH